ncbi:MAG TPA: MqnA/MqnD/SBP family protein [Acidobacteriaceae bacterium]|nr:MqnA/MqnD/SBP family protein [Acidobacteriaceae bacterium]
MTTATPSQVREISIAHSPDSDDAFMFYALATDKVTMPGLKFTHTLTDIETLNQKAMHEAFYDVTAISFHAYPYVQEKYALMPCGGSVGEGYGPMIVARQPYTLDQVRKLRVAIPGKLTTANLMLRIILPDVETEIVPFDQIIPQVLAGKFDAGLIIHEGQLTYARDGLHLILDVGQWWREQTGLPLPLGGNAIRRDLGAKLHQQMNQALRASIRYALEHRDEALRHAMQYARDLNTPDANQFVGMYVNERTIDYGEDGKEAIRRLLAMGQERGIIPHAVHVDFVG